jgi:hypothetical protein
MRNTGAQAAATDDDVVVVPSATEWEKTERLIKRLTARVRFNQGTYEPSNDSLSNVLIYLQQNKQIFTIDWWP